MAEPDDGAIEEDIGDAVWEESEDECPFAVSEVGKGEADEGCEDGSSCMCKGEASKFEVALELGFGGECSGPEEVKCAQYAQGNGDFGVGLLCLSVCDVGVECAGEFKQVFGIEGDAQGEDCADAAQADAEYKVRGCKVVDIVVFVQEGVVQSEVADGDDKGEYGIGCCDGAKVFGYEDLKEQEEDREVDDSRRVGAAEGLDCAAGNALDGGCFSWCCGFFHCICIARLQR